MRVVMVNMQPDVAPLIVDVTGSHTASLACVTVPFEDSGSLRLRYSWTEVIRTRFGRIAAETVFSWLEGCIVVVGLYRPSFVASKLANPTRPLGGIPGRSLKLRTRQYMSLVFAKEQPQAFLYAHAAWHPSWPINCSPMNRV